MSITNLVHATDYDRSPKALCSHDHKAAVYDAKQRKHTQADAPIIFDYRASIEPRSRATLKQFLGPESHHRLRLYLQQVTAAIARMLARLDSRNTWARMVQSDPLASRTALEDDDTEAWVIHLAAQDEENFQCSYVDECSDAPHVT